MPIPASSRPLNIVTFTSDPIVTASQLDAETGAREAADVEISQDVADIIEDAAGAGEVAAAAIVNPAAALRALLYPFRPLPLRTRDAVLFDVNSKTETEALSGEKTWTDATGIYRELTRGSGSNAVNLPAIGSGEGEVEQGHEFYVRCPNNDFETITFKNAGGSTVLTVSAGSGNRWVFLTAGASDWTGTDTLETAYGRTNAVFQHIGTVPEIAGVSYPDNLVLKAATRTQSWRFRFRSDASLLWMRVKDAEGFYSVYADGELVSTIAQPNDGSHILRLIQFADAREREIEIATSNPFRFGGIYLSESGATITASRYAVPSTRLAYMADSIGEQVGGPMGSACEIIAHLFDWEPWNSPLGSTGYVSTGVAGLTFADRVAADIIARNPQIVIVGGGINDAGQSNATFQAAVESLFDTINTGLPDAQKIALSPYWANGSPSADIIAKSAIIEAVASAKGWHFIDMISTPWITGQWNVAGSGSAPLLTSEDSTHPTSLGVRTLGVRLAYEIGLKLGYYAETTQ